MAELPNDYFRHLCLDTGVALIATDLDLRIRFWNRAAGRVFGGSAETMLGQQLVSIVPAERRELAFRLFERALHRGEVSDFEFPHRGPSGEPMYLAVTISPVLDDKTKTMGISVYVRNVTRRMELEREMATTQKMSALGAMAGGIAHHFNNVIGGVITSIDFAQTSDDPQFVRRLLSTAVSALSRASQLTQSLLVFAEGDRTDSTPADLVDTVREYLRPLTGRLARQRIELVTRLQAIQAAFPLRRINTILERLIDNAIEAMPQGGTLHIETYVDNGQAVMLLRDTGVGISSDDLSHLFEPFFTTKTEINSDHTQHVGLGLAVVHGVVRDLGGTVCITSEPDQGTTCVVRLPLNRP